MTAAQVRSGVGLPETSTGQQLPVADALRLADQAELALLIIDAIGRPLRLHRSHGSRHPIKLWP